MITAPMIEIGLFSSLHMKQSACLIIFLIAITVSILAQQTNNPPHVAVPDEPTAVTIAEKALAKIYGEKKIASERPFKGILRDGIWHVGGTLHCKDKNGTVITGRCFGGVAIADIRQSDGRVLRTGHFK